MATSGSFNTNKVGEFYVTVSWNRTGYNATKNEHYISYKAVAHNAARKYRSVYLKELNINGTRVFYVAGSQSNGAKYYDGNTITSGSFTIASSNSAGDGSIAVSFQCGVGIYSGSNCSGSGSWSLDRIPRYATSNQTTSGKTETTISMNWSSDSTIDYIWYSINNGSSWVGVGSVNSTSGSYTISNLAANTAYNIKTRVRRKDSGLTTDSSTLAVTTYNFPYATSMPNFTIGNKLTLGFYNPLGRSITFYIIANGTQIANNWTITGTSYTGVDAVSSQNQLYATIPNTKSATYQVKVVYGSSTITKTGGTYSVNQNNCIPNVGTLAYLDTNSTTTAITGNNQKIIQNNSTLRITITNAQAKNSATLSKASVNINGNITQQNFASGSSSMTFNLGVVNVSSNLTVPITVTDSRGISKTQNLTVQIVPWSLPTAIINLERVSNFYTTTNLKVNANYSSLNNQNTITIKYQIKKVTDANYGSLITIQNNVQTQFQADNQYEWNVKIILTDRLGTTTYNLKLSRGVPIIYFDRILGSTGFNCFPKGNDTVEINYASIVESGSNSNGSYVKYYDGTMICYGSKTETLDITSSYEGEYFANTGNVNFPISFVGVPTVIVTLTQNSSLLRYNNSNIYTDRFVGYISKLQSKSNVTLTLDFMAIGKWK